jgi:polyphosphate kinase
VEAVAPVTDPANQDTLRTIVEVMLADDRRAWQLDESDRWRRVEDMVDQAQGVDTFEALMGLARSDASAG